MLECISPTTILTYHIEGQRGGSGGGRREDEVHGCHGPPFSYGTHLLFTRISPVLGI